MRVYFVEPAVFDDPGAFDDLGRLFFRFRLGQHEPRFADADLFLDSAFFAEGLPTHAHALTRELVERLVYLPLMTDRAADPLQNTRPSAPHVEVRAQPGAAERACLRSLTPADAARWCEGALVVLLENDADAALLRGAARAYRRSRVLDAEARRPPWLVFDGRGGHGEVRKKVEAAHLLDRVFAIVDGDDPENPVRQGDHERLRNACAAREPAAPHHIWRRRNIEGYLPLPYLRRRAGRNPTHLATLDALESLGEALAGHDLKTSFSKRWRAAAIEACDTEPPPFSAAELDDHAGDELRQILNRIEEWL